MTIDSVGDIKHPLEHSFEFGEVIINPRFESKVPAYVTDSLMVQAKEVLPEKLPLLGSTIIEDFIADKLHQGLSVDELVGEFESGNIGDVVEGYIGGLKNKYDNVDWEGILSELDILDIRDLIAKEMGALGIPAEQIEAVKNIRVEMSEKMGSSSADYDKVYVSRMQCLRKAMDYVAVFPDVSLERALQVIMRTTVGHELGHHINDLVPGIATNNISGEWQTSDGGWADKLNERFSEYWGRLALGGDAAAETIRRNEWLLQMAKVNSVWQAIAERNKGKQDDQKIDLFEIFRGIVEKLAGHNDSQSLLEAREGFYGGNEVESYANPYDRETIRKAVSGQEGH